MASLTSVGLAQRRLQEPLATSSAPVFVCGTAVNQDALLDVFTWVFRLRIDARAQEDRLVAPDGAHPPGRVEAERQEIRERRPIFESQVLRLGATPVHGTRPTPSVVDQILGHLPGL